MQFSDIIRICRKITDEFVSLIFLQILKNFMENPYERFNENPYKNNVDNLAQIF